MTTMAAAPTEKITPPPSSTSPTSSQNSTSLSSLPLRLRNFFAKYPPQHYSAAVAPASRLVPPVDATSNSHNPSLNTSSSTSASTSTSSAETTATSEVDLSSLTPEDLPTPYTPNRDAKGNQRNPTAWSASKAILYNDPEYPNPFLPQPAPGGKKWRSPKYGLRQQADLIKLARKYGVEELLPTSRKSAIFKQTRLAERGLAIKGTGIGQKVKGHKWERTMETRLEERKKAMIEMPELIRQWKQVITLSFFLRFCSSFLFPLSRIPRLIFSFTERSWTRLEEMAQTIKEMKTLSGRHMQFWTYSSGTCDLFGASTQKIDEKGGIISFTLYYMLYKMECSFISQTDHVGITKSPTIIVLSCSWMLSISSLSRSKSAVEDRLRCLPNITFPPIRLVFASVDKGSSLLSAVN